tara:strand:- start:453 stop:644 length:192 start_codon:yes stop_codon:yes gene_type:complete
MSLDNPTTNEKIFFTLDGKRVEATKGETIWQVAKRYGVTIPHLCWKDAPGLEQMEIAEHVWLK